MQASLACAGISLAAKTSSRRSRDRRFVAVKASKNEDEASQVEISALLSATRNLHSRICSHR